jgi:hypothetical protein
MEYPIDYPPFVIKTFRESFPEFADTALYTDGMLNFWSCFATRMVNCGRWKSQTLMGIYLYVAHEITLAAKDYKTASMGGAPGGNAGMVNTKTVGPVTVGYDTEAVAERNAGWFNSTSYGRQFFRLARIFGSGAVQL